MDTLSCLPPVFTPFSPAKTPPMLAVLLTAAALSAGCCAQQQANGYYEPPGESTTTDAQAQGSGSAYSPIVRAPSQVQIVLKNDTPAKQRTSESAEDTASASVDNSASNMPAQIAIT